MISETLRDQPHRRFNPLTREWVLVSPHRAKRPWLGQVEKIPPENLPSYDPTCYLCPGNERAAGRRNPVYTGTFVFDNDFPALLPPDEVGAVAVRKNVQNSGSIFQAQPETGLCRVVCFSPRHDLTLPEMPIDGIEAVVRTWTEQTAQLGGMDHISYVQVFENKGAMMGCSNPHPHSQIWATSGVPNEPAKEVASQSAYLAEHGSCLVCDYLAIEQGVGERIVASNQHFTALVPFWSVWPFELMLISHRHAASLPDLTAEEIAGLADLLRRVTIRYDNLFEVSFPYSMGFHQAPTDGRPYPQGHLHAHFYPPLLRSATVRKFMVGFELLGMPQRDLTAETAAERLRGIKRSIFPQRDTGQLRLIGKRDIALSYVFPHLSHVYPTLSHTEAFMDPVEILITMPVADNLLARINELAPRVKVNLIPAQKPEDVPADVWPRVEVLYTNRIIPTAEQASKLRWIQFHWAGVDHALDAPFLQKPGLMATTLSGSAASQMGEYVLQMLLALGHRLPEILSYQKRAEWPRDRWERFLPLELRGSTVGIVGYGSIGRQIARLLQPFGATVLATKKDLMNPRDTGYIPTDMGDPDGDYVNRLYPPEALRSMLKDCDFVVITVPKTQHTIGMIGLAEIASMKPTAFLIDVSRGGVVDHAALLPALKDRKIAGAALDVYPEEPLPSDSPLWKLPNVILTPHISGNTVHYNERAIDLFIENLQRYLNNLPLYNLIDMERGY